MKTQLTLQDIANTIAFLRRSRLEGEESATHAMLMQKFTVMGNELQKELQEADKPPSKPTGTAAGVKKAAAKKAPRKPAGK